MRMLQRFLPIILLGQLLVPVAHARPEVRITRGSRGSAIINVSGAYSHRLRMTVPAGVARQLVQAARKGGVTVSTARDVQGPMVRVVAGMGDRAVVVGRYRRAGRNGQNGASGVRTVQYGLGAKAKAFYVGRTRRATTVKGTRFRGNSTVTRYGWSTFINPKTLKPTSGKDRSLRWYWKPVTSSRVGRVERPSAPLDGFNLGDFGKQAAKVRGGNTAFTAAPATLIDQLGKGL